ncbi:HAD family hydrolase [Furfurilactobacillus milii]|uniref:HAD family hydrolase n=1 Tax=Furfurilactobacillus milii TaxID=2888272 RepID=A0ABT6DC91_9LACO|nr:HAD-IA family hydrolase [Furfurilactobacillus milii]QLE65678.1 phosphatase [Furfurilactobacillus rossiae]MCF6161842.1 HAD family hydrolase [Furfurilactobacillus milii]MCF6164222.1 HAD family hydrolase [Furfurilactobacillus milii]MDF9914764.1 HAD family hydrolase [Furfurilactobacillus milii]QLE68108.1 putative phosphatase [Furfurilactobacillus rossiae]
MQNFVFDVDGTLIDSEKMYMLSMQRALAASGRQFDYDQLSPTFGTTGKIALQEIGIPNNEIDGLLDTWQTYTKDTYDTMHVYPGITSALAQLHENPRLKTAIVTSKAAPEYQRDLVENFPLDQYMDDHVTADEVERGKPAPDSLFAIIHKMKLDPTQTIYVGDTIYDLQAAHAAGLAFALATWGGPKDQNLIRDSEEVLDKPHDLLNLI